MRTLRLSRSRNIGKGVATYLRSPNFLKQKQKQMKKLFQYTVLFHEYETTDKGKTYKDSKIISEPKFVLATSEKEVVFKATREVDEKYAADSDNVQILIRNF